MYRKLELSVDEMYQMRKSGLSNHDIAKTLGIGIATVRRYIGSQGGRIENLEALKDPAKRKTLAVNDADVARQELKKVDADLIKETYESKSNIAEIHYKDKNVFINNALSFETFDDFMDFAAFIMSIANHLHRDKLT